MLPGTPDNLQVCDQAGTPAGAKAGVCGCPEGGLHTLQKQPKEGEEASNQEVVLYSNTWVWLAITTIFVYGNIAIYSNIKYWHYYWLAYLIKKKTLISFQYKEGLFQLKQGLGRNRKL